MKKKYLVVLCFLCLVSSCKKNEASKVDLNSTNNIPNVEFVQVANQNNQDIFFSSEKYKDSEKSKKCIDESEGDFSMIKNCVYENVYDIKEQIKNKIKAIGKENTYTNEILNSKYKKIEESCNKKVSKGLDYEYGETSPEKESHIAICIQDDLYKFGRDLKIEAE